MPEYLQLATLPEYDKLRFRVITIQAIYFRPVLKRIFIHGLRDQSLDHNCIIGVRIISIII